jgi:hypothetical protein
MVASEEAMVTFRTWKYPGRYLLKYRKRTVLEAGSTVPQASGIGFFKNRTMKEKALASVSTITVQYE